MAMLDDTLTHLRQTIAALERKLEKMRAVQSGMMQALLTGRVRLTEYEASK